jgi:protein-disulfide isomerase
VVFKHLPLDSHPKARGAAIAMQAAHRQGKAWEMHDLLFENRKALDPADLEGYAGKLGLDVNRFKADLDDPKVAEEVDADKRLAESIGVRSTPTCYANGEGIRGAQPLEDFAAIVAKERSRAEEMLGQGVSLADLYDKRAREK